MFVTLMVLTAAVPAVWAQTHADTLMTQLRDKDCDKVFVVSHRADWRNAPENSLQAIQNCIDMGVDMVEIDLKKTKDGELILCHDKTLDRTTTGKGAPGDYTLDEIRTMYLRNGAGHRTEHRIPTLREVMTLTKGKILVNIDKGYDYFTDVYQILKETGTLGECIIKATKPCETVMAENPIALSEMLFMPVVILDREDAGAIVDGYRAGYVPLLYELVFAADDDRNCALIERARQDGAKVFINSLWPELCGRHHDDRAVERGEPDESWGWLINHGAKLLQTDRPAHLLEYLRTRHLHD